MRRWLIVAVVVVAVLVLGYRLMGESSRAGDLATPQVAATIGSGEDAVAVGADGTILVGLAVPEDAALPQLPLSTSPEKERLAGTLLEQAKVLGAAPAAIRPHIQSSSYGESGVDVELRSGIELRFGSAAQAARKWRAAATVLADPSLTALDYVNLHAPSHPSLGGSGHELPPLP